MPFPTKNGEAVSKDVGKEAHTDHHVALLVKGVNLIAFDHKNS
jgi:hypothetical protein